jgi:1-deoxy-D-xylulose 5-phosphate reductoisomerase
MPMFVATHRHSARSCPISADSRTEFLSHVSAANAARYEVTVLAEAIIDGEHRLLLVLEAADQARVERFLEFLTHYGAVEILSARSIEAACAGGCIEPHNGTPDRGQKLTPSAGP